MGYIFCGVEGGSLRSQFTSHIMKSPPSLLAPETGDSAHPEPGYSTPKSRKMLCEVSDWEAEDSHPQLWSMELKELQRGPENGCQSGQTDVP
ncbi:hypothetical protein AV530_012432 [Patagioenas fasciata monilis]|uniref:Uncharacterized protein n=1 Tax=Patagioenas fasciata monilis TaxID=372326 RepID=A0A1V4JAX7_PATFA|nr:hypothetical protein AV530_012432 [Patagioenas fasciata monilis]